MNIEFKKRLVFSLLIIVLLLCTGPSYSYVLQGPHILDLMVENLGKSKSLYVSQKLIYYPVVSKPGETGQSFYPTDSLEGSAQNRSLNSEEVTTGQDSLEFEGSLRFVFSKAFRSDSRSPDSERILVFTAGRSLTLIDGNIVTGAENRFDLFKDLLFYRSRTELAERLIRLGVDVSVSSLGRFEEKIAFVVGANYPDESVSQVWIDRDTFLPIRWIIKDVNSALKSDSLEIRYLTWWKIGKTRYPSRIEFYQDGNLVRVNQAINFEEDANFSRELFDIEHLKNEYPRAPVQPIVPGEPDEPDEPSEIEKAIEEFRRIFE